MINTLKLTISLLSTSEIKAGGFILFLVVLQTSIELTGILSIIPVVVLILDPSAMLQSSMLQPLLVAMKDKSSSEQVLVYWVASCSAILILIAFIIKLITQNKLQRYIETLRATISHREIGVLANKPLPYFITINTAELLKKSISEVDQLANKVLRPVVMMLANLIVVIISVLIMLVVDPLLTILSGLIFSGLYAAIYFFTSSTLKKNGAIRAESNNARYVVASELFRGIRDLKLFGGLNLYLSQYQIAASRMALVEARIMVFNQVAHMVIEMFLFLAILAGSLVVYLNMDAINSNDYSSWVATILLFAMITYKMKPSIQICFQGITSLAFAERVISSEFSSLDVQANSEGTPSALYRFEDENELIKIEKVSHQFDRHNPMSIVLENVNLEVKRESVIGLIGGSGSGKSTLLDIISGLIDPTKGLIIRDQGLKIGYLSQMPHIFEGSLAFNISMSTEPNFRKMRAAAKVAGLEDFVDLDSNFNRLFFEEGGLNLSGGQKQRIALARVVYMDPDLILLDEATSALDPETEALVLRRLKKNLKGKAFIIAAHRFKNLEFADSIYKLKEGHLIGPYDYTELA